MLTPSGLDSVHTSRELQVARFAAAGHASARIADQLGLSSRKVNNYLGRVYHELGINSRSQLRHVLTGTQ
jgi:DNA-binding CsgD family transcriptional regulator